MNIFTGARVIMKGEMTGVDSVFYRGSWLFGILCIVTFLATITTGKNVFDNAWLIFGYEVAFTVPFAIWRITKGFSEPIFPVRSVGFWLLALWFCSMTFSLVFSPYGLMMEWFAVQRYFQSIFHVIFFLCVFSFISVYKGSLYALFLSLGMSVFVLAIIFIISWLRIDPTQELPKNFWYLAPPLNAHIRITDFLATAGASLFLPYLIRLKHGKTIVKPFFIIAVTTVVWGFLFWCGGRGGIFSALLALVVPLVALKCKREPILRLSFLLFLVILGGAFLAKLFTIFPWNGLGGAAQRTMRGGMDIYRLSNSRFDYWLSVWGSLKETGSYVFGLGSQGYCYMPNRIYAFQPHNLVFQFLAEWGIAGTVLFLSTLAYGFFMGAKVHFFPNTGKLSIPVLAALSIILSLGLHSLFDGIFYHAQPSMHLAIAFAVWMSSRK